MDPDVEEDGEADPDPEEADRDAKEAECWSANTVTGGKGFVE